MKKRVADIIAETIAENGINHVFMITGGGAMHLNDGFGRCKKLKLFFNHHEQASAIAAEAYCRLSGKPAVVNVTTGPGGVNALNGVYGAYVDSIAMVVISGQIKRETLARNFTIPLRQLGDQEVDIISMVKPITKYATVLQDPLQAKAVVQKALYLASCGRPGPVWIDVPMDVQGAVVEEENLAEWSFVKQGAVEALRGDPELSKNTLSDFTVAKKDEISIALDMIFEKLTEAKRPVIFAGTGVRVSGCAKQFTELLNNLKVPAVAGWNAIDVLPSDHPSYAGKPGAMGERAGNFTVQNSDFVLIMGCRLNIRQISYNWKSFAKNAWKAQIDVDSAELAKPTLNNDLTLQASLEDVIPLMLERSKKWKPKKEHKDYLDWCKERVKKYPVFQEKYLCSDMINPYHFLNTFYNALEEDDIVITANGSACVMGLQAAIIKKGTRLLTNSGDASMGYDLPAAIGAAVAAGGKRVICLSGDGSIMMNLQELETVSGNKLPIHVYMINNKGYSSILQTQTSYFSDNLLGVNAETGLTFPDFGKVSSAFEIPFISISDKNTMKDQINKALKMQGPVFCEVIVDPEQFFEPKLLSRRLPNGDMVSPELDDMAPFLSKEELDENRISI